ncbi:MAG TPA: hypothetical protein VF070_48295 [Streptosporangiaceae bacterium]
MRSTPIIVSSVLAVSIAVTGTSGSANASASTTTAWRDGHFVVDPAGVVGRSDIVLDRASTQPSQSMPLGDGQLGAAVWGADGMTIQLNRADTMPYRRSPGWVVIPGLSKLTSAPDFHAVLDLYNGELTESGGGMTATVSVEADQPDVVISVTGADPATEQTAQVELWQPRTPAAAAVAGIGTLAQTWTDAGDPAYPGGTGHTFGSLAAITAAGRNVMASVVNPLTVQVSFKPDANGSYRVVVAAPHWAGGDALTTARQLLEGPASHPARTADAATRAWWHRYWQQADPLEIDSADGTGQYMENLRTIYLYAAAAERGSGDLAGSQAGTADLFSWLQDTVQWDPAAYWIWNQRMQLVADQGAGVPFLNDPFFGMYRDNLASIRAWTAQQFPGLPGACVPETMRFNGNGYSNGTQPFHGGTHATRNLSCSSLVPPTYNGENITSGAELTLYAWWQYRYTGDITFLKKIYPLMASVGQFLLAYAKPGPDGLLHTVANAHETQWEVQDPTTDIAAMRAVFPVIAQAARLLHRDPDLVSQLQTALKKLPPFPLTNGVIADSYQPAAPLHNTENIGTEPAWPYKLLGPDSQLVLRSYSERPNVDTNDWSFDAVDAAQLGIADAAAKNLVALSEKYQLYPSGMAHFIAGPPYVEQTNVALALQTALVQDNAGTVEIAPAWPRDWNVAGSVAIVGRSRVDVQATNGTPTTVAIEAGAEQTIQLDNPWPGQAVRVLDARSRVLFTTSADRFPLTLRSGGAYLVQPVAAQPLPFAPVAGQIATTPKTLGPVSIGLTEQQ